MDFLQEDKFQELFPSNDACFQLLLKFGVFYETIQCTKCDSPMRRLEEKQVFRCRSKRCSMRELSIRKYTFLFHVRISLVRLFTLARLWLAEVQRKSILKLYKFSKNTVTTYFEYFRQVVTSSLKAEDTIIGGEGIIIEVDETKLGKRKYNKGHRVDGVWVLCGIERTKERRVFCIPLEKRDSETIEKAISEHVLPGSIVYTDLWRGYKNVESNLGFCHLTVNHSRFFKDPITGVHTNTVEGTNNGLKTKILPRNRIVNGMEDRLGEFVWRRINNSRLAEAFLEALRDVHYE